MSGILPLRRDDYALPQHPRHLNPSIRQDPHMPAYTSYGSGQQDERLEPAHLTSYQPSRDQSQETTTRCDSGFHGVQTAPPQDNANSRQSDPGNPALSYRPMYAYNNFQGSFLQEPANSSYSAALHDAVDVAANNAWQTDLNALLWPSPGPNVSNMALTPGYGLNAEQTDWATNSMVGRSTAKHIRQRNVEDLARKDSSWQYLGPEFGNPDLSTSALYREVEKFWPDPVPQQFLCKDETNDHDSFDVGSTQNFDQDDVNGGHGAGNIATTATSLPVERQSNPACYSSQDTYNPMHDSAVCMDDSRTQAADSHSQSSKAVNFGLDPSMHQGVANSTPQHTSYTNWAPFGTTQYQIPGFWNLDQDDRTDFPGRAEAPYDTSGLWSASPDTNFLESSQGQGYEPFVNDQGADDPQASTFQQADFGAGTNGLAFDPLSSFNGGFQLQDAAQLEATGGELFDDEALPAEQGPLDLIATDGPAQQYRYHSFGDINNPAPNICASPEHAALLGEDLQRSIHSATSAISSITAALAHSPAPTSRHSTGEARPTTAPATPPSHDPRPLFIRHVSADSEGITLRTPTPRRITDKDLKSILSESPTPAMRALSPSANPFAYPNTFAAPSERGMTRTAGVGRAPVANMVSVVVPVKRGAESGEGQGGRGKRGRKGGK